MKVCYCVEYHKSEYSAHALNVRVIAYQVAGNEKAVTVLD